MTAIMSRAKVAAVAILCAGIADAESDSRGAQVKAPPADLSAADFQQYMFEKALDILVDDFRPGKKIDVEDKKHSAREYYRVVFAAWLGTRTSPPIVTFSFQGVLEGFWRVVREEESFKLIDFDDPLVIRPMQKKLGKAEIISAFDGWNEYFKWILESNLNAEEYKAAVAEFRRTQTSAKPRNRKP